MKRIYLNTVSKTYCLLQMAGFNDSAAVAEADGVDGRQVQYLYWRQRCSRRRRSARFSSRQTAALARPPLARPPARWKWRRCERHCGGLPPAERRRRRAASRRVDGSRRCWGRCCCCWRRPLAAGRARWLGAAAGGWRWANRWAALAAPLAMPSGRVGCLFKEQ